MFVTTCSPLARNVVRGVFRAHPNAVGLTSHDIYNAAITLYPTARSGEQLPTFGDAPVKSRRKGWELPPQPENPDHPIRSLRYLKKIVLEYMAKEREVSKVHVLRGHEKDDDNNPIIKYKLKGGGESITVPYEHRHPTLDKKKEVWLWRHINPDRLNLEERVLKTDAVEVNMKKDFDMPDEEIEWDRSMKFIDCSIPQDPRSVRSERRKSSEGFGMVTGNKRRADAGYN